MVQFGDTICFIPVSSIIIPFSSCFGRSFRHYPRGTVHSGGTKRIFVEKILCPPENTAARVFERDVLQKHMFGSSSRKDRVTLLVYSSCDWRQSSVCGLGSHDVVIKRLKEMEKQKERMLKPVPSKMLRMSIICFGLFCLVILGVDVVVYLEESRQWCWCFIIVWRCLATASLNAMHINYAPYGDSR